MKLIKDVDVEKYVKVLDRNNHHRVALEKKTSQLIRSDYFKKHKAKSERDKIRTANRTFFIKGFDYVLAYRVLYNGPRVRFTCVGLIEHHTPSGIIYENAHDSYNDYTGEKTRVIHLSHYFDRMAQRNVDAETRHEAIKRYLNDELLVSYCIGVDQQKFDKNAESVDMKNGEEIDDVTFYSDNGLGLGFHYPLHKLIVIKTYVSEEMLRDDDQHERFEFYQQFKKRIPSAFKNVKEIEAVAKLLKQKEMDRKSETLQIEI